MEDATAAKGIDMASKYWIKLYQEILYDPKMGMMSDRLWRRTIELFLMAGEMDDSGNLPPIDEIAWKLRLGREQLETEMIELQETGILSRVEGRWYVTKFEERQAPMDKAEYMRRKREGDKRDGYYQGRYQGVTSGNTDTDKKRIDKDTEGDNYNAVAVVATAYQQNIGMLTPMLADEIKELCQEYPQEWITEAIKIAVQGEKRNMRYVQGILRKFKQNGFNTNGRGAPADEWERIRAEYADK